MQTTSQTWKELLGNDALLETRAIINGVAYTEITPPSISRNAMKDGMAVGNANAAACLFTIRTTDAIPKSAEVKIEMRLTDRDEDNPTVSEWLPAGTFYISRRARDPVSGLLSLECYDSLLKANSELTEVPLTVETGEVITTETDEPIMVNAVFPRDMTELADEIAFILGVEMDSRTHLKTGPVYVINAPKAGTTIRDILGQIAAANAGNWIITPENKLRLVPLLNAQDAEEATENVADVNAITGTMQMGDTGLITGVEYTSGDNYPILIGDRTGRVVKVTLPAAQATGLADDIIGLTYLPYTLTRAIYDPAVEIGDYIRYYAVSSVIYSENVTLGAGFFSDVSAPDFDELADEFPYPGASEKALSEAKQYAVEAVESAVSAFDDSLNQEEVFNRLTNNGADESIVLYNGHIYINASYIRSGTVSAEHIDATNLHVNAANVDGTLVIGQLPSDVATESEVTTIANGVITTAALNADNITSGTMSANHIKGGTLTLGGLNNNNGMMQVLNSSGNVIGTWNGNGISVSRGTIKLPVDENGSYVTINERGIPFESYYITEQGEEYKTQLYRFGVTINNISKGNTFSLHDGVLVGTYMSGGISGYPSIQLNNLEQDTYFRIYTNSLGMGAANRNLFSVSDTGYVFARGGLMVDGTKSRVVSTDQYSDRLLYCYETPSPMFGDIGEGTIGEDGLCYVTIDPVFAQTITTSNYQVFLQKYGDGDCYVRDRKPGWFVVAGTPGLSFGWELKAKQHDYDQKRLERNDEPFTVPAQTYGADAAAYIDELRKERIPA